MIRFNIVIPSKPKSSSFAITNVCLFVFVYFMCSAYSGRLVLLDTILMKTFG